jgi:hypothetical protein
MHLFKGHFLIVTNYSVTVILLQSGGGKKVNSEIPDLLNITL